MTSKFPLPPPKPFLIVFGDSLSLPQWSSDQIESGSFSDTWPGHILESGVVSGANNFSVGGYTARDVYKLAKRLSAYLQSSKNFIVIFVGVVDAAPRPFPKFMKPLFYQISLLMSYMGIKWLPHHSVFLLQLWGKPYLTAKKYKKYLRKIHLLFPLSNVAFVNLAEPGASLIKYLGNYSVENYNLAISSLQANNIYHINAQDYDLQPDGHHLSNLGHTQLGKIVINLIDNLYKC